MDEFVEVYESFEDSDESSASLKSSKYQVKIEESNRNGKWPLQLTFLLFNPNLI